MQYWHWHSSAPHQLCPYMPNSPCGFPLYTSVCLCVGLSDGRQGFRVGDLCCVRSKLWYFQSESQFHGKPQHQHDPQLPARTHTHTHKALSLRASKVNAQFQSCGHTHEDTLLDLVCALYQPVVDKAKGTYLSV